MTHLLSQPAENLLDSSGVAHIDTLVVGSGYGAAMAALSLSDPASPIKPSDIWVMERGREYQPGEFPKVTAELPGHLMATGTGVRFGERDALFDLKVGDGVSALVGSGLGGTSLINGGIAIDPADEVLNGWPERPDGRSWQEALQGSLHTVKRILGVTTADGNSNRHPRARELAKYRALGHVADGMRNAMAENDRIQSVGGHERVPLAINFETGPNAVGIQQHACIDCGNCITGCNIGAKNTLAMNVWPLVESRGVQLFTGGTVLRLRRPGDCWAVDVVLTRNAGDLDCEAAPQRGFSIHARRVILAAGTFGSTEILKRSEPELTFSRRLGERFSVNGDMMIFGLRRQERVNAAADTPSTVDDADSEDPRPPEQRVGPLTTSEVRVRVRQQDGRSHAVSLQDGSVPFPMRRFFGELLATEHLARLFVDGRSPEQLSPNQDPLAVDRTLLAHSQLITVMGWEPTSGRLELKTLRHAPDRPGEQVLSPIWDAAAETRDGSYFDDVEMLLDQSEQHGGFDGGHVLPCPPWRMVPKGLEMLEGFDRVNRHLVTTHPLGGCCMANDATDGVVDTQGRVFCDTSGIDIHPDLFVMDGAIIPGPIGVNPLVTIATVAHHLAAGIARVPAAGSGSRQWNARRMTIPHGEGFPVPDPLDETVSGTLHERLFLDHPEPGAPGTATAIELRSRFGLQRHQRLVFDIATDCKDLFRWLERPSVPLPATFRFAWSTAAGDTVPDTGLHPLGEGPYKGCVTLGGRLPAHGLVRLWRRLRAMVQFLRLRGDEIVARLKRLLDFRTPGPRGGLLEFLRVTWGQARVQADWRYMRYAVDAEVDVDGRERRIRFRGQKTLAYAGGYLDPLNALRRLPFSLDGSTPKPERAPHLRLDMIRFTRDLAPFQVHRSPDTPTTVMALASAGLFFLRGIIQTHFWSFGAPSYDQYLGKDAGNEARTLPPPRQLAYRHNGTRYLAPLSEVANPPRLGMRLVRYRPLHLQDPPAVLLIHGLAHGSRVFWTDSTPVNMAQHLLDEGYEVWLLDHRLSCNLHRDPRPSLTMEDIADVDIPWAVRTVYDATNAGVDDLERRKVKVFAHCIGAGAFAMSTLGGRLASTEEPGSSMVDSVVIHAVTPWLVASEDNRWRANAISLFRSYFDDLAYDPIPHSQPHLAETLADRFSSSFGWPEGEFELHRNQRLESRHQFSRTICNRMTLFYGDEWIHENLDERTHASLDTLVGPAPIEVLRQVYYCIVKGRLTNREGTNEYVREPAIAAHWTFPTLFLHGSRNKVFDADGSRASALKLGSILEPLDTRAPVALRVIRGYGHMDMLFGKSAHQRVFPSISAFLARHELPAMAAEHLDDRTEPSEEVRPPLGPATGPIVSQPTIRDGRHQVTVWSELSQYTSRDAVVEYHSNGRPLHPPAAPLRRPDHGRSPAANGTAAAAALPAADTRLHQLDVTGLSEPITVTLRYQGDRHLAPEVVARLNWTELPWFQRAFAAAEGRDGVSFLVGSCLYPGSPAERAASDRVFAGMRPFVEGREAPGIDHLLLVGDQIYADATANLFDPAAPLERFRDRYRRAFGGPQRKDGRNAHWVLSHVPSYFAVDDHEISNNWPNDRLRRRHPRGERYAPEQELEFARGEARSFMIHAAAQADGLWYPFESAGYPFFVFDTRTERRIGPRAEVDTLISREQQLGFGHWLHESVHGSGLRPVIVTGSPLGPISRSHMKHTALCDRSDALVGFPGFLCWLHDTLTGAGIDEVIWISGDAHLSCRGSYALRLDGGNLDIEHIVASGLYAPLPFANHAWSGFDGPVSLQREVSAGGTVRRLAIEGEQHLLSTSTSHFVHVTITGNELHTRAHNAER